ncbi:MAG TPA: chemotaxis protein CheW [Gammaproteobacteria bacterium]|jgi:twitching motility protein PilI|nr:chemotaxis protein CheW [Gammaproteobacteria bacterium]
MTGKAHGESPFELLQAQERRASADKQTAAESVSEEWTGLLCRIGSDQVLAPMSMLTEIVPPPEFTRIPGTQPWVRGLANLHGSLVTVVDLQGFLLGTNVSKTQSARRMLVVSEGGHKIGLLVNEVYGMRHFKLGDEVRETPAFNMAMKPYITAALKRHTDHYAVFNLQTLLSSTEFLNAAL